MQRRTLLGAAALSLLANRPARAQISDPRVLRLVPHANLTILDPHFTTALVTTNHGWAIYDTLFGIDAAQTVQPQMAAGYRIEDDGRTCLITLREGLRFHNGEPVLARDCARSLARWAAREVLGQSIARFVDAWDTSDDRTIRISLKRPLPALIPILARGGGNVAFMLPEHVARTDPFKQITDTTGSGPFQFQRDEFVPGAQAVYTRFPGYVPRQEPAGWTAGGKIAHFERVEWKNIPDSATAAAALMAGEVDWYEQVQPDLLPLLRGKPAIEIGNANPSGYNGILRFNHLHPPFNNQAIRQAVMMAVDQADYMAAITGNDPTAFRVCKSLLPCGTLDGREIGTSAMPADLEKAKAALKAAGYNNERVVIISPADFASIGPMGEVGHDLLRRLGMNVELVQTDWGTVNQRRNSREPVDKGGWSILHTWGSTTTIGTPVSQFFMRGLGDSGWAGWFKDEQIEALTDQWLLAGTEQERALVADRLQARAFETVPSVPLGQFQIRTALRRSLTGRIEATGAFPWNIRRV